MALSGHIHLFQALEFDGDRPAQIVAGMSVAALDPQVTTPLTGLEIDGMSVAAGATLSQFGYVTLDRTADGWLTRLHDLEGDPILGCALRDRSLRCQP